MSADQGFARGQYRNGECLDQGKGVPRNLQGTMFQDEFRPGIQTCAKCILVCLYQGEDVEQNMEEAARYFRINQE